MNKHKIYHMIRISFQTKSSSTKTGFQKLFKTNHRICLCLLYDLFKPLQCSTYIFVVHKSFSYTSVLKDRLHVLQTTASNLILGVKIFNLHSWLLATLASAWNSLVLRWLSGRSWRLLFSCLMTSVPSPAVPRASCGTKWPSASTRMPWVSREDALWRWSTI